LSENKYEICFDNKKYFVKDRLTKYEIPLDNRIFNFVTRVIKYLNKFQNSTINNVIIFQLTKASSSIGVNYEEAQGASSRKDFISKVALSHREAKESHYWLRLIKSSEIDDKDELNYLIRESFEIRNILGSIVGKARRNK